MSRITMWMQSKMRAVWHAVHLKSQGQYSVNRLRSLDTHLRENSLARSIWTLLWTPLPALLVVLGTDLFHLASPKDGYRHNGLFWVRVMWSSTLMIATLMLQLSIFLPGLNMKNRDIALITVFTTSTSTLAMLLLAAQIGYPLPFTITIVSPYTMACLCSCTALRYGHQMLRDETLRRQLVEYFVFMSLQYGVTIVYPIYAFIFTQVDSVVLQTLLACVLPLTKLLLKVVMSRAMSSLPELRPAFLMFNVEVFNALFIASCLQSASSSVTTIAVMVLDTFFNMLTLRDVSKRLNLLTAITRSNDKDHISSTSTGAVDLIECAVYLINDEDIFKAANNNTAHVRVHSRPPVPSFAQVVPTEIVAKTEPVIRPVKTATNRSQTTLNVLYRTAMDNLAFQQKVALVRGVLDLLYFTEFVILTEYVEVVVPAIYAAFLSVVYQLPNRVFYPQFRGVSADQNAVSVQRVLVYVSLELASFFAFQRLLLRRMKLEPLRQLGFVLREHWWFLPMKLMLWVAFILHCAIEHYGVDYTFRFAWLGHPGRQ